MFTGLIQEVGTIQTVVRTRGGMRMGIATHRDLSTMRIGASVAVDGVCLTVIQILGPVFTVEVSPETMQKTTLGDAQSGQSVNLEEPLRLGDPLGGHLVSGHVDGTGRILEIQPEGNTVRYRFGVTDRIGRYLIEKGSVAVDGISLTVVDADQRGFSTVVLDFTARSTTLGRKKVGDQVNLENDLIAKYVEKFIRIREPLSSQRTTIDVAFLAEHGYLKQTE